MSFIRPGRAMRSALAWLVSACLIVPTLPAKAGPMDLGGQFSVSESGAATYTIPIQVPPGTAGIEPKLALSYNSQTGNGLLGVGWSLSGLSAITRCPRTLAQDGFRGSINFDSNDRFCMDGQRLMVVSGNYGDAGSEYRTERDSFSKIIANGGAAGAGDPTWFKVLTKAGQILEYGNTSDSRIEAQGKSSARVWAINKISDTKGNYLTFSYTEDNANGDYYPARIDYTGNAGLTPNASVQFSYEDRTDALYGYVVGSIARTLKRLTNIKSYVGATAIKDLRLAYGYGTSSQRSRLLTLTECDGSGAQCRTPISLTWQDVTTGGFDSGTGWWSTDSTATYTVVGVTDVDGDGKADLIVQYDQGGTRKWEVRPSLGNSFGTGSVWASTTTAGTTVVGITDVNGDGKPDLVLQYDVGTTRYWQARLSTGSAFVDGGSPWVSIGATSATVLGLADINGDGKTDLVVQYDQGGTRYWGGYVSTGTSFDNSTGWWSTSNPPLPAWLADVDGDGKADLVVQYYTSSNNWLNVQARLSNGTSFSPASSWWWQSGYGSTMTGVGMADVNGDGLADFVLQYDQSGTRYWKPLLSSGKSFNDANTGWWAQSTPGTATVVGLADVNGDGRADLNYQYDQSGTRYWMGLVSSSAQFKSDNAWWSQITPGTGTVVGMGDVNGDGKADLVIQYDQGGVRYWQGRTSTGPVPDLLTSITNGFGALISVTYQPLTNASIYFKDTGTSGAIDVQAPMYVVSSVSSSNGVGGTLSTSYQYGGLKAEAGTGRGLLGFRWQQATSTDTGVSVRTDFRQDWPYIGLPSQVKKTQTSAQGLGNQLSLLTNTYSCLNPATGSTCTVAAGNRYFPYLSQSVESSWDLNGTALPTVTTTNSFDSYGNATQVGVSTSDGYSKTTTNTYTNDTTNWYLGRLSRSQVRSVAP